MSLIILNTLVKLISLIGGLFVNFGLTERRDRSVLKSTYNFTGVCRGEKSSKLKPSVNGLKFSYFWDAACLI